jgi:Stage II sporulation protein E (SpoIIE)
VRQACEEPPVPTVVRLPPGAMLLLVTDGVVERRDRDIDTGYELLTAAVRHARTPDEVLAAVDGLLAATPPDDDALYAVVDIADP